jgi:predicted amidohydrolase YtcJ
MRTLFSGGSITTLTGDRADWVLVDDQYVHAAGTGEAPRADRSIDLEGGALVPSFCDAHVHLPITGLYQSGLDLRDVRGKERILAALGAHASRGGLLFAGNFEDIGDKPLTRTDLERVVGDRPALVARADLHSCVVSRAVLEQIDLNLQGVDRDEDGEPTGYLREKAAGAAWHWFEMNLSDEDQRGAIRAAIDLAMSRGVTEVHEMFVLEWRDWSSIDLMLEEGISAPIRVLAYVATDDVARIKSLGLESIGGDFFLDGSFGSHTAWLSEPYTDQPPSGSSSTGLAYRSDDEVEDFFREAHGAGLQVGVHAIGDAAIGQALEAWRRIAAEDHSVATAGHRIEHFECAWDDHIDLAASLGIRISAQPAFDRFWGGDDGLYARRIGRERASHMNRFKTMREAGLVVGAGSDSTVTPLDPFIQMAALRAHNIPAERMTAEAALKTHTIHSRSLAPSPDDAGRIGYDCRADLVWLDRDPLTVDSEELLKTEVLGTWRSGRRVWPKAEAES